MTRTASLRKFNPSILKIARLGAAGAILAAAFAVPACAQQFSGAVNAGYGDINISGASLAGWTAGGSALVTFDNPGFNIQVNGGDTHATILGASGDLWNVSGDAYWRDWAGDIGVSVGHEELSGGGLSGPYVFYASANATSYGAFGEWYATRNLTLRIKGGATSGDGTTAGDAAAGVSFYPLADLSLNADYQQAWALGATIKEATASGEFLLSRRFPLSVSAAYLHYWDQGGDANGFLISLNYRFGLNDKDSLVQLDRTGPTKWDGTLTPF